MIIFLILFLIKHYLADKTLQSYEMSNGKRLSGIRGWDYLGEHAFIHSVLLFIVIYIGIAILGNEELFKNAIGISLGLAILDFILHFIIDKGKVVIEKYLDIKYGTTKSFVLMIIDQGLHGLSYMFYIYLLTK